MSAAVHLIHCLCASFYSPLKLYQAEDASAVVSPSELHRRLNNPVVCSNIDENKVSFSRQKSGIWGFQSEREEEINGYNCKVRH